MPQAQPNHENLNESLTRLAAGELNPFAAWRLRRRIENDPALRAEWEAVRRVWSGLGALGALDASQPAGKRPRWRDNGDVPAFRSRDTITIGGFAMNRRLAFAGLAASLLTVTGAFAAHQLGYDPFRNFSDKKGNVLSANPHFRGEAQLFDASGNSLGSIGTDDGSDSNISADVTWNSTNVTMRGAGRHDIRNERGELMGYVVLKPESAAERRKLWDAHEKAMGHDAHLPISSGAMDGWGVARGYFGDAPRLSWTLHGVGEVHFLTPDGRMVLSGIANPVDDVLRGKLRTKLGQAQYKVQVADSLPETPVFEWHDGNGATIEWSGIGKHELVLPDGTRLDAEIFAGNGPFLPEMRVSDETAAIAAQRDANQKARDRARGIDERLPDMSTSDITGFGMATGTFGDEPDRLTWKVRGIAHIQFERADNGKVVVVSEALPYKQDPQYSPDGQQYPASGNPPEVPYFEYTLHGKVTHKSGWGRHPFTLPNGLQLTVDLEPRQKK